MTGTRNGRPATKTVFLIWWATNTRAASAFIFWALKNNLELVIVAMKGAPEIKEVVRGKAWVIERDLKVFDKADFLSVARAAKDISDADELVLVPTSEYLQNKISKEILPNWLTYPFKSNLTYEFVSSKEELTKLLDSQKVVPIPKFVDKYTQGQKLYAKPRTNIVGDKTLKPFIVEGQKAYREFENSKELFFMQEYIEGPSYYWCGYRNKSGSIISFVQENLGQVNKDGSVFLARVVEGFLNPQLEHNLQLFLMQINFVGPIMFEFRGERWAFIEANPRFWGPLLLDVTTNGRILTAFVRDYLPDFGPIKSITHSKLFVVPGLLPANHNLESHPLDEFDQSTSLTLINEIVVSIGGAW